MRKLIPICILVLSLVASATAHAESKSKLIHLRDGSSLTGNVLSLNRGVYTVQTANLGIMKVKEEDIISISNPGLAPREAQEAQPYRPGELAPRLTTSNLGSQVQTLQGSIMQDPELLQDIQVMMSDPEIVKILTDQAFMEKIMTLDMESIENDPRYRDLMYNPRMRRFIQKLQARDK
ncbi:MAG: hypothetical protein K8I00_09415 [Candidatus Omnitrophica bacterium]|nr:hypothetical protein [Candidatus Omnitrophota bacterium]